MEKLVNKFLVGPKAPQALQNEGLDICEAGLYMNKCLKRRDYSEGKILLTLNI
jgi:hypothetical protein